MEIFKNIEKPMEAKVARTPSIRELLTHAKTVEELDKILAEAKTYQFASEQTKRRWVRLYENQKVKLTK